VGNGSRFRLQSNLSDTLVGQEKTLTHPPVRGRFVPRFRPPLDFLLGFDWNRRSDPKAWFDSEENVTHPPWAEACGPPEFRRFFDLKGKHSTI
jgi:hypothetical protein